MQNKGAIRFLAILLVLVCVYHLSFTYKAIKVRNDAKVYAQEDLDRESHYLDSISGTVIYNFLGLRQYTYAECVEREMNLGLDLKGGMSVILEVSVMDVLDALASQKDEVYDLTMERAIELHQTTPDDFITAFGKAFDEIDPEGSLAAYFHGTPTLQGRIGYNSTNTEVLDVLQKEARDAINNSFSILRNRIDRFGVAQPNIQRLETHGRIMVELPGVTQPERVRSLLQSTAQLEFWETYENDQEFFNYMEEANRVLKEIKQDIDAEGETSDEEDITDETSDTLDLIADVASDTVDEDTEGVSLLDEIKTDTDVVEDDEAVEMEEWAVNNPLFAVLRPNVTQQGQLVPGASIGIAQRSDMQKVEEYLSLPRIAAVFPRDAKFYWSAKPIQGTQVWYELYAIKIKGRDGNAPLDGDVVVNARSEVDQTAATYQVSMSMNTEGARTWARLTRENLQKCIAIVLDDRVYSAPRVQSEIKGGSSQISGNFTASEAQDLANVLRSGKLPAPANIIQEAVVGPSLGQEAIDSGLNSFIIAFIVVLLYMLFYYSRSAGLVADIALVANMFFLIGVLAAFNAVLTLPGIAGIVLTIGMSVDANVLIYERIREEIRAGKGPKLAIKDGYNNAYSAIIDANVTTLLTGIILFLFGSGPIRGFATTLIIGICTSLFSAIFITRLSFEQILSRNWKLAFSSRLTENLFTNLNIPFIKLRKVFYVISGAIVAVSLFGLITSGLTLGVDFSGGRTYIVRFEEPVSTADIRAELADDLETPPEVIVFGDENQVRITTQYRIDDRSQTADDEIERVIFEGLQPFLGDDVSFETFIEEYRQRSEKVGPTIAEDIKREAVWVVLFSLLVIFVYLLIRFRRWQYGLGAITALIHDTIVVLGIFAIFKNIVPFSLEIDQAFIAAILTVVGYSINDTVVVFDRIREQLSLYPKRERNDNFNTSLNKVVTRTVSTSLSTFVVLLTIFIFGGEVIRGFTFALLIGVVVGTYSSMFIATPIAYDVLEIWKKKKRK